MTTKKQQQSLSELLDAAPIKRTVVRDALGLSDGMWWQITAGNCILHDAQARVVASLLGLPLRAVKAAADESRRRKKR